MPLDYEPTDEFLRDLKKLSKKFRTLSEDLEVLKKAVIQLYHIQKIDNNAVFAIPGFQSEICQSYKIKKFASKSLKGKGVKTGLRLIYIFKPNESKVILIEMYYKGQQTNEDKNRLKKYFI
jgi:mRNA-degrading endonuclease RelE of RelBE toxin-antitoxin system